MEIKILPVTLEGERVRVVPVDEGHLEDLMAVNGDDEVTRYLPYETWQSMDDAKAWLERMRTAEQEGTTRQYVLVHQESGRAIGTALLFKLDKGSERAELGYVLGRAYWGQGIMKEALILLLNSAVNDMGLRRIEAEVNPANSSSHEILLRLGFQHEGCARQRWMNKGVSYDTNCYGLLRNEWLAHQES